MAKKKHKPTKKAREAYNHLIEKSYKRLRKVMVEHRPDVIAKER